MNYLIAKLSKILRTIRLRPMCNSIPLDHEKNHQYRTHYLLEQAHPLGQHLQQLHLNDVWLFFCLM